MGKKIIEHKILMGKSPGKKSLGTLRICGENNKLDLTQTGCEVGTLTELAQNHVQQQALVLIVLSIWVLLPDSSVSINKLTPTELALCTSQPFCRSTQCNSYSQLK
jgi:hypothetical protein